MAKAPTIYQTVTAEIVAHIENAGENDQWKMPWSGVFLGMPENAHTGQRYNGINVLVLWTLAVKGMRQSGVWSTYRQWQELGAQVRKGEKASPVVYVGTLKPDEDTQEGDDDQESRRFLKGYRVFNADQVDGYEPPAIDRPGLAQRIEHAERYITATGAVTKYGYGNPHYNLTTDEIGMLDLDRFHDTETSTATENAYASHLHELTHWTGAEHRLNRITSSTGPQSISGPDDAYAFEELIAEIGAAILCAKLGITPETRPDHSHYIAHWLRLLKDDERAIFRAAAKAAQAVDYLDGLQQNAAA